MAINSEIINVLEKRRSIRKFKSTPVEPEKIQALIEAAVRTPTSRGRNPWEFIVVTEPDLLPKLAKAKAHGSAFLAEAPLAVVVAADTSKSDAWVEDCSIAAFVLQLVAEELGLGSCWVQIRMRPHDDKLSADDYVRGLFNLPETHHVECIIGIGYRGEAKAGHSFETLPFDQVHRDKF